MLRFLKWVVLSVLGLAVIGVAAFWAFAPAIVEKSRNTVEAHAPYPVSPAAQALHDTLFVGDWHADSLLWNRDLTERADYGQVDLPRLAEGGVGLQVFTAVTKSPAGQNYDSNTDDAFDNITLIAFGQLWPLRTWTSLTERALYQAEKLHGFEQDAPDMLKIIRSAADLEAVLAARAEGAPLIGAMLGIEGGHALEGSLANLDRLEEAGYRVIGLHHFFDNALGGSLHGQSGAGLTGFGRDVVASVANRGMVIDLAHSSAQVARDVLAMTDIPLIVSHTGLHSVCDVQRNYPDDLMREIAATGGVIGIGYWADVVCGPISPAGIANVIVAAIAAVGEDHVSLGSDFDGSVGTGFDASELPALTHALLSAGLSEEQVRKVMGENMLRVLRARLE
ncbi:MAG: dipeptidase [Rhodobacteraceae bacterium]|nr:dipeptidase [Paracoccaceae bacterium]